MGRGEQYDSSFREKISTNEKASWQNESLKRY